MPDCPLPLPQYGTGMLRYRTGLRCWIPEYRCRRHRRWCRCPPMHREHIKIQTVTVNLTQCACLSFILGANLHCKEKMPKIGSKYSQKRNIGALVPISTFMCLWVNYIFPRWSCRFCWRKYVDRSWEYINRSQTHECRYWRWGCAIPRKGIYFFFLRQKYINGIAFAVYPPPPPHKKLSSIIQVPSSKFQCRVSGKLV